MKTQTLDYLDQSTQLEAFLAWDDKKPEKKPAVLVAHDWTGRREFAENKAKEMADLGYVGFALDMYGKGVFGADGDVEGNGSHESACERQTGAARRGEVGDAPGVA